MVAGPLLFCRRISVFLPRPLVVSLGEPKQPAVLGMLIAGSGDIVSVNALIGGVWGPDASLSLRSSVHTYISNQRVIVGRSIERIGDGYRRDLPIEVVDALVFEQLVDEAVTAQSVNPVRAADLARKALALWRGRPYADIGEIDGFQSEIRRLDDSRLRAVETRIEADLGLGRHRAVIGELEALTIEHPLNEGLQVQLVLALYRDAGPPSLTPWVSWVITPVVLPPCRGSRTQNMTIARLNSRPSSGRLATGSFSISIVCCSMLRTLLSSGSVWVRSFVMGRICETNCASSQFAQLLPQWDPTTSGTIMRRSLRQQGSTRRSSNACGLTEVSMDSRTSTGSVLDMQARSPEAR